MMNVTWHLIPMALVVSLVYCATRYELPEKILRLAARRFVQILLFMAAIFALLLVLSYGL